MGKLCERLQEPLEGIFRHTGHQLNVQDALEKEGCEITDETKLPELGRSTIAALIHLVLRPSCAVLQVV
jgi:hypothetical protein